MLRDAAWRHQHRPSGAEAGDADTVPDPVLVLEMANGSILDAALGTGPASD